MKKIMKHAGILMLFSLVTSLSYAQQTTERYIPIGKSPGVSGSQSVVGAISRVDDESHEITISSDGSSMTVTLTPKTRYYLDRSHVKQSNQMGSYEDCEPGRYVEVDVNVDGTATWVKIKSP